jgi:hypothetical protein
MKKRLPLLFLPVALLVCFLPCLVRAQPSNTNEIKPPQLLTPESGSTVKGAPEFFWTSAVLPRGFKGRDANHIRPACNHTVVMPTRNGVINKPEPAPAAGFSFQKKSTWIYF